MQKKTHGVFFFLCPRASSGRDRACGWARGRGPGETTAGARGWSRPGRAATVRHQRPRSLWTGQPADALMTSGQGRRGQPRPGAAWLAAKVGREATAKCRGWWSPRRGLGAMMGGRSLESETKKKEIGCYVCNKWQWWIIFPSSTKLGFGGAPLEVLHQMVNLGGGGGQIHRFGGADPRWSC